MVDLGNAVYRQAAIWFLKERGHGALAYAFTGNLSRNALTNPVNYVLAQVSDSHPNTREDLTYMTDSGSLEYWFCYGSDGLPDTIAGYIGRLKVLKVARWLADAGSAIGFTAFDAIDGKWTTWDGSLSDVDNLRCDGFVELCFEFNGIDAWGKIDDSDVHYDLYTYVDEHNDWQWGDDPQDLDWDMYTTLQPVTQGGYADDYISEHEPSYTGGPFRGTSWQTGFHKQRLVRPEALSPESATQH